MWFAKAKSIPKHEKMKSSKLHAENKKNRILAYGMKIAHKKNGIRFAWWKISYQTSVSWKIVKKTKFGHNMAHAINVKIRLRFDEDKFMPKWQMYQN